MKNIPKRDITGQCEGECRDRINESNRERQKEMKKYNSLSPESYPNAPGANKRSIPPGAFGGHV